MPALGGRHSWAHDCRHGRVLINNHSPSGLIVWDPITGDKQHLSEPAYPYSYSTAAVLCAVDDCHHLDCHGGPFRVVFVGSNTNNMEYVIWVSMYSSEIGTWSALTSIQTDYCIEGKPTLLIGNSLYFTPEQGTKFLTYDLAGHELSEIDTPSVFGAIVVEAKDRGLGYIASWTVAFIYCQSRMVLLVLLDLDGQNSGLSSLRHYYLKETHGFHTI
ncbi:hypothetical protein ACP70R_015194 [Stipagrostis hirtigluma subsp. patula]